MLITVLAASGDTAEAAGAVVGRLLFLALGAILLVIGLRRRAATAGSRGTALAVAGGVILALGVLGTVAGLAASNA